MMRNFVLGIIFGIIVSTVGFSGVAHLLDSGVQKVKTTVQEQVSQ